MCEHELRDFINSLVGDASSQRAVASRLGADLGTHWGALLLADLAAGQTNG